MWDLVGNPEDRFSHDKAHIVSSHFLDTPALKHYWQNEFHSSDNLDTRSDVVITFGNSFIRRAIRWITFTKGKDACIFSDFKLLETHVLYVADNFYR